MKKWWRRTESYPFVTPWKHIGDVLKSSSNKITTELAQLKKESKLSLNKKESVKPIELKRITDRQQLCIDHIHIQSQPLGIHFKNSSNVDLTPSLSCSKIPIKGYIPTTN